MDRRTWWERLRGVNPTVVDGLLAATIFAITLFAATLGEVAKGRRDPDGLAFVLILVACMSLMFRRRWVLPVLWIVCASVVAYVVFGYPDNLVIPLLVVSYTAASIEPHDRVLTLVAPPALAAGIASEVASQVSAGTGFNVVEVVVGLTLSVGIPIAVGRAVYNRRRRLREDRERMAHDAVAEERARIARELHDIVAHAMSVMVVQAGAARTVVERDPAQAVQALRRIEETGRTGMAEMRRLIGVLKADDDAGGLMPQPGLGQLDRLVDTVRGAGLPVETVIEGSPRPLPPGVDLTAYRIVQEGLTNVLKHAGGAHARATVRYDTDSIGIEVADDGRGAVGDPTDGAGHGLIGMRERVAVFDGTLETGARAGGGFVLRARIPLDAEVDG